MLPNARRTPMAEPSIVRVQGTAGLMALKAHFREPHADMPRHARALTASPRARSLPACRMPASFDPRVDLRPGWVIPPRAHSSAAKTERQGSASTAMPALVSVATAVSRFSRQSDGSKAWLLSINERKRSRVLAAAQANNSARITCASGTARHAP